MSDDRHTHYYTIDQKKIQDCVVILRCCRFYTYFMHIQENRCA